MKTEAEIRKRIEDTKAALNRPCDCAASGHAEECERGAEIMAGQVMALRWVLGIAPDEDRIAEMLADDVRRAK